MTIPSTTVSTFNNIDIDRKIENATEGLLSQCAKALYKISHKENALTISSYILTMKTELNPSDNYRRDTIILLTRVSSFSGIVGHSEK